MTHAAPTSPIPLSPSVRDSIAAPNTLPDLAIRATNLSKRFKIYPRPIDRALEWLGSTQRHTDFWAVRNVSFDLPRGQCLGILGANGSGKSTLLKMITGALHPTEGSFEVGVGGTGARVLSLIELGTGLNPQLTGRQNVFNAAQLLNFPPDYAANKINDIERFADIAEFFDRPVRTYSSGMTVRLAFSMFACFDPDILIVDEALSVGDVFFQQKCIQRMDEMLSRGITMLFVSHDVGKIQRLCTSAILMEKGHAVFAGAPEEAVNRYHTKAGLAPSTKKPTSKPAAAAATAHTISQLPAAPLTRAQFLAQDILKRATGRHGEGGLTMLAATFTNPKGGPGMLALAHQSCTVRLLLHADRSIQRPSAGLQLYDSLGNLVFAAGTKALGTVIPPMNAGDELVVSLTLTCHIAPGQYTFALGVSEPGDADDATPSADRAIFLDMAEGLGPLVIGLDHSVPRQFFGLAQLPLAAEVSRCSA